MIRFPNSNMSVDWTGYKLLSCGTPIDGRDCINVTTMSFDRSSSMTNIERVTTPIVGGNGKDSRINRVPLNFIRPVLSTSNDTMVGSVNWNTITLKTSNVQQSRVNLKTLPFSKFGSFWAHKKLLEHLTISWRAQGFDHVFPVRSPAKNPFDRSTEKHCPE